MTDGVTALFGAVGAVAARAVLAADPCPGDGPAP